ncbi:MAG: sigma-70 family RNA polymerase sigma factor [Alphaproteobacteria bacterium]|nr:sigma-70 family RNA polymerase sigma factor [Alphaproteobacteria bacterium]
MSETPRRPANDSPDSWETLAVQAQKGDRRAYHALLRAITPYIYGVLTPALANPDWVDDIAQDVLLSVHKSLQTYRPDRPFKPWLAAIIGFRKTDFLRRHYAARQDRKTSLEDPAFMRAHVTDSPHAGEYKDVERVLAAIPEKSRRVFDLVKIKGYTAQEAAAMTGMSVSAVKVSVHRSMNRIKGVLGEKE